MHLFQIKEEIILQTCSPLLKCVGLVHCFLRQILQKTLLHTNMPHDFLPSLLATIKYVKPIPQKLSKTSTLCALRDRSLGQGDKLGDLPKSTHPP